MGFFRARRCGDDRPHDCDRTGGRSAAGKRAYLARKTASVKRNSPIWPRDDSPPPGRASNAIFSALLAHRKRVRDLFPSDQIRGAWHMLDSIHERAQQVGASMSRRGKNIIVSDSPTTIHRGHVSVVATDKLLYTSVHPLVPPIGLVSASETPRANGRSLIEGVIDNSLANGKTLVWRDDGLSFMMKRGDERVVTKSRRAPATPTAAEQVEIDHAIEMAKAWRDPREVVRP